MSDPGTGDTTQTLSIPGGVPGGGPYEDERPPRASRFWAARRVSAALVAAVLLAGSAALLYDVAAVRADRPAQQWRRSLADYLAARPLDSVWTVTGAAAAVVLGLWLVLLACTPGMRAVLPMRPSHSGELRAGIDRKAAALVLRDTALQVPGVSSARVRVSRHRARVWVWVRFRELDEIREELDAALTDGMDSLGLARPLRLRTLVNHERR